MPKQFQKVISHIDKKHKTITKRITTTTQVTQNIRAAVASRYTFMGGHIRGSIIGNELTTVALGFCVMAIVHVSQNETAKDLNVQNGGDFYQPEVDIIWSQACVQNATSNQMLTINDKIKTKRKIAEGDTLEFIARTQNSGDVFELGLILSYFVGT